MIARNRGFEVEGKPYWIAIGDLHDDVSQIGSVPGIAEAQGVLISGDITNYGNRALAERLLGEIERFNPTIFAQIGNMDTPDVEEYLEQRGFNAHARVTDLGFNVGLVGVGYSTPTPFGTPSEVSDAQIQAWLEQAMEQAPDFEHLILMAHNAPYGTGIDRVGFGQSVGSRAVREFIERHQPDVCIGGHIHESKGVDSIGKTQIVNTGLFIAGGYVLIRLVDGKLEAELQQT